MRFKKVLSVVVAAAMTAASTVSLGTSVIAYYDSTLQPLKEIRANSTISGYTKSTLDKVKLSDILDNMTYAEDVYEDVTTDSAAAGQSDEAITASVGEANAEPAAEASAESFDEASAESVDEASAESANEANAESADEASDVSDNGLGVNAIENNVNEVNAIAARTTTKVHSTGDKVVFADDAKYVWVGNEEYSIYDKTAVVDLSSYANSSSETFEIIVGAAKQLSVTDIIYRVMITFNLDTIDYGAKFYYYENDKKVDLTAELTYDSYSSYSGYTNLVYYTEGSIGDKDIFIELNPSSPNYKFKVKYSGLGDNSQKMKSYSYTARKYIDCTIDILDASDESLVLSTNKYNINLNEKTFNISNNLKTNDGSYALPINPDPTAEKKSNCYDYTWKVTLESGLKLTDKYFLYNTYFYLDAGQSTTGVNVLKAVAGKYDTLEAAKDQTDIKDKLIKTYNSENSYLFTLSPSPVFTFFIDPADVGFLLDDENAEALVVHLDIQAEEQVEEEKPAEDEDPPEVVDPPVVVEPSSDHIKTDFSNAYFRLRGVDNADYYFIVDDDIDTYYKSHYQTAFIYDPDNSVDMSQLMLDVSSTSGANVYASLESKNPIDFASVPQDFSTNSKIAYSVAAGGGQGYYPVTIKKNSTGGPELFVNGPKEEGREVYFDSVYGFYHDVLIANLGDADLTGVKVELNNAVNVKLDDYWRLDGEENFSTLGAFTSTYSHENLAKVRLRPITDENGNVVSGEVSGQLVVTANGEETITINLTGHAGNPKIISKSPFVDAVKYVPYSVLVAVDNIHEWNKVTFKLSSGTIPEGLTLNERNGEIYGVPQETGTFRFTVVSVNSYNNFSNSYKSFELTVKDNNDENVYKASDESYDIKTPVGTKEGDFSFNLADAANDQLFVSNGEFDEFIDFWFNGEKLVKDTDYTAESGSTKITIKSQTLQNKAKTDGANTIAAEFRVGGSLDNELKRTSQNFTIGETSTDDPATGDETTDDETTGGGSTGGGTTGGGTTGGGTTGSGTTGSGTTGSGTSAPVEVSENNDLVFTPANVETSDDAVINGTVITAAKGVLPENAVLNVKPDETIPSENGIGYDITFTLDNKEIQPNGNVYVKLPIPEAFIGKNIYLYHIEGGKYKPVPFEIKDGFICFTADHFSTYVISDKKLDKNGKEIPAGTENPATGVGLSALGLIISSAALVVAKKKF